MSEVPDPRELVEAEPSGAAPAAPARHDPYAALRHAGYRLFAIGGLLASLGSQMQAVAVGWEIYERTGRAMALGWVGLVQALPIILFALPAGQLADRFDRKRLLAVGLVAAALTSAGLAGLSWSVGPLGLMYVLLFVNATARALIWPASSALMPQLVPRPVFSNAVTWKSTTFQTAAVAGPALGGLVIGLGHQAAPVYLIAASFLALYALLLTGVRANREGAAGATATSDESGADRSALRSLLAGVGFVLRTKVVLAAITLDMFAVLLGGATALMPIFAKDILGVGPAGLGWLRAAPAVGALVMAVTLAHRPPLRRAGPTLLGAVAAFGVVTIVFGLSRWFWLSLAMLGLAGAVDNISVVVRHSLVQMRTPDAMRGRVSAVNAVFISCSNELGEFESGFVAAWFGPVLSVVSGGVGTILVVLVVARLWPEIRRLQQL